LIRVSRGRGARWSLGPGGGVGVEMGIGVGRVQMRGGLLDVVLLVEEIVGGDVPGQLSEIIEETEEIVGLGRGEELCGGGEGRSVGEDGGECGIEWDVFKVCEGRRLEDG